MESVHAKVTVDSGQRISSRLDLVVVQVRWAKAGTEQAKDYTFSYRKGNENNQIWQEFVVHYRIIVNISVLGSFQN
jgi:hypothetical protein